jgi:hypothetical protein
VLDVAHPGRAARVVDGQHVAADDALPVRVAVIVVLLAELGGRVWVHGAYRLHGGSGYEALTHAYTWIMDHIKM